MKKDGANNKEWKMGTNINRNFGKMMQKIYESKIAP